MLPVLSAQNHIMETNHVLEQLSVYTERGACLTSKAPALATGGVFG